MKIGLQLGYWGAGPPPGAAEIVDAAEHQGFDAVFAAESWGSDAFTPLSWWGSSTSRVRLGTSVAQLSARSPASCAMHALTLDHLSAGRCVLGLGVSGPQVVEGWYGEPFAKPLARTREYVSVVRQVLAREAPVRADGPHYPLPYDGTGSTGLGKSLKPITHPLRADLPVWLGAEGPRNVAQTAEIADGWIAVYFSPKVAGTYAEWLADGFARPGARRTREDFEVAATAQVVVTDDPAAERMRLKPSMALYIGGMGAPGMNFHAELFRRMGYPDVVDDIARLYPEGERERAAAAIPDEMVDDIAIIGSAEHVRTRVAEWEQAGVDTLLVGCRAPEHVAAISAALDLTS